MQVMVHLTKANGRIRSNKLCWKNPTWNLHETYVTTCKVPNDKAYIIRILLLCRVSWQVSSSVYHSRLRWQAKDNYFFIVSRLKHVEKQIWNLLAKKNRPKQQQPKPIVKPAPDVTLRAKNEELHLAPSLFGLALPPYLGIDPTAAASSIDAIYGALGCATWTNITNRGCDNRKIRIHFMSESWMFGRRDLLDDLRNQYKARRTSLPHWSFLKLQSQGKVL